MSRPYNPHRPRCEMLGTMYPCHEDCTYSSCVLTGVLSQSQGDNSADPESTKNVPLGAKCDTSPSPS